MTSLLDNKRPDSRATSHSVIYCVSGVKAVKASQCKQDEMSGFTFSVKSKHDPGTERSDPRDPSESQCFTSSGVKILGQFYFDISDLTNIFVF